MDQPSIGVATCAAVPDLDEDGGLLLAALAAAGARARPVVWDDAAVDWAGVPTVPTVFMPPGSAWAAPEGDHVVKPSVSGSAADTGRFSGADDPAAAALVARLHAQGRTGMIQPYCSGIEQDGETSVVFLGGVLSHAMRREPLLTTTGERSAAVVADVLETVRPVS